MLDLFLLIGDYLRNAGVQVRGQPIAAAVAQGRPDDPLLTVAVHTQPAAPQAVLAIVHQVPGVSYQLLSFPQLKADQADLGPVKQVKSVRVSLLPSS